MCPLGIKAALLNEIGSTAHVDNGGVESFMFSCAFATGNTKVAETSMAQVFFMRW